MIILVNHSCNLMFMTLILKCLLAIKIKFPPVSRKVSINMLIPNFRDILNVIFIHFEDVQTIIHLNTLNFVSFVKNTRCVSIRDTWVCYETLCMF